MCPLLSLLCLTPVSGLDFVHDNEHPDCFIVNSGINEGTGDWERGTGNRPGTGLKLETSNFQLSPDTLIATDSTQVSDTLAIRMAASDLEAPIIYKARDSIVYDLTNELIILYGDAQATYQDISLNAHYIEYDWKESMLFARGLEDSLGNIAEGKPVFTQEERTITARALRYNFKSKKGKMYDLYTQEAEGYIHSDEAKRDADNNLFANRVEYTTCEYEDPHFYIEASPVKIAPNRVMVSGPANLVIEDVRTPLALPFAIFPLKTGQRSGILIPELGNSDLGFSLTNGGYYFGISDYADAAVRGDVFTNGSWRLRVTSDLVKRYKYHGNLNFGYGNIRLGSELEGTLEHQKDFKVGFQFTLDPKALPNHSLSASVNVVTTGYDKYNDFSYQNHLNNTYTSSIRYAKTWPGKPFNFSANLGHSQNTSTHIINFALPELSFGISRLYPFKRKVVKGKPRWYEKIAFTYSGQAQNRLTIADSLLFTPGFLDRASIGAKHSVPVSTTMKLFKYINVSPSFGYTELWFGERYDRTYNPDPFDSITFVEVDTIKGFSSVRYYDADISVSTRLYGRLNFRKGKLKAIRHVITPTISANYRPDFGAGKFGYYEMVQKDTLGNVDRFYRYPLIYGQAPYGEFGGITFSLNNNLEMKVFSKKDTLRHEKKIKLLESLTFSGSYNFAVDSFQLSKINVGGYTVLFEKIRVNFNAVYDPYALDTAGFRIDQFEWTVNHRLARLEAGSVSVGANFRSKPRERAGSTTPNYYPGEPAYYSEAYFPYSLGINYVLRLDKGTPLNPDTVVFTQSINANVAFSITPKWSVDMNTGYDFINRKLGYTTVGIHRDLHCWEMKFNWIPLGTVSSYTFGLNVRSTVLKDLKIEKKKDPLQGVF